MTLENSDAQQIALLKRELRQVRRQSESMERQQRFRIGAMQTVQRELEGAVHELQGALEASERASRTKETLLANLSHELRTPLHGIQAAAELLQQVPSADSVAPLAEVVATSSAKLWRHLESLLNFADVQGGSLELDPQPVELMFFIDGIVAQGRSEAGTKGIGFNIDCAPGLPGWVHLDRKWFAQVLSNLVHNAVRFTSEGRVDLIVSTPDDGQTLSIEVEDTGRGIPLEEQGRIFEAFSQVDETRSRDVDGAGLGLALASHIVATMGGEIALESEPGKGTRVSIQLPLVLASNDGDAVAAQEDLAGVQVLVVDDIAVNLLLARKMLQRLGCTVTTALSGEAALEALDTMDTPDLILMDCSMPGMDGYETTVQLRSRSEELRSIPVVALTAHAR